MAKRYRLPSMKRSTNLIRIARTCWTGGRGSAKAIWVPAPAANDAALICRSIRRLAILPDKRSPQVRFHLRPTKSR